MNQLRQTNSPELTTNQWTHTPLRLETITLLSASPKAVFDSLTDPEEMCRIFAWMNSVSVSPNQNRTAQSLVGTRRQCHFGNGMVLEEEIVAWNPPLFFAYRGIDETHPFGMAGHIGTIECQPMTAGTHLVWKHYFDHANPEAMVSQLEMNVQMAIQSLQVVFSQPN